MTFIPASLKLQTAIKIMMKDPVNYEGWFYTIEKLTGCKFMIYFDDNNKDQAITVQEYINKIKGKL
jgi:hypothetical protein